MAGSRRAPTEAKEEPLVTRAFLLIVVAHFLQALGYSSMLLLPLYLQHIGASRTEIGLAMGSAAIAGLATRPLVGWGLDRWGRKPVLFVGTVTVALGMALVGAVEDMGPIDDAMFITAAVFGISSLAAWVLLEDRLGEPAAHVG